MTFFTISDISPLWMDQFGQNWWLNWDFFDALNESGKIFDRYDLQNFWETLKAGAKKWIFSPFWQLWSNNLGTSKIENDKKSVGKLNYRSRSNQWCNWHVNRLKHKDLAKLQRSVGMIKWHFLVILVIVIFEAQPNLYALTYWHADCTTGYIFSSSLVCSWIFCLFLAPKCPKCVTEVAKMATKITF